MIDGSQKPLGGEGRAGKERARRTAARGARGCGRGGGFERNTEGGRRRRWFGGGGQESQSDVSP